jgi:peptide/nickel transport system permease protein
LVPIWWHGRWTRGWRQARMAERVGFALVGLVLISAVAGPLLTGADPFATEVAAALLPPGAGHPFGTDHLGRDMLARVVGAARLDFGLAVAAVALAAGLGAAVGAVVGWFGGWADRLAGWAVDLLLALPIYLLAMVLAVGIGNGLLVVVLATAVVNVPFFLRLVRTDVARQRRSPWVDAARMGGAADRTILFKMVVPRVLPLVAVQGTTNLGWAMLNAAGLSFIGVGVRPPTPEWGILIAEGARYLASGHWWLVVFPGLALALSVLAFHLTGDALRDRLARGPA